MKKWLASLLAVLITAAGYTIVDQALVDRVDVLEYQVNALMNASEPTTLSDVDPVPRPDVTYLEKYVLDILRSGAYTAKFELTADGLTIPLTQYSNADNYAANVNMGNVLAQQLGLPPVFGKLGEVRLIVKNKTTDPQSYIAFAGGYTQINGFYYESFEAFLIDADAKALLAGVPFDDLLYCGKNSYKDTVVEKYRMAGDNTLYRFYFDSQGVFKMDMLDLDSRTVLDTIGIRITSGVNDKNAFKLSGKEYTAEELEKIFGGLS